MGASEPPPAVYNRSVCSASKQRACQSGVKGFRNESLQENGPADRFSGRFSHRTDLQELEAGRGDSFNSSAACTTRGRNLGLR
jgi:hypothetical protein